MLNNDVVVQAGPPPISPAELVQRLRDYLSATKVKKAILFGSFARGSADAYSDVDLLLI